MRPARGRRFAETYRRQAIALIATVAVMLAAGWVVISSGSRASLPAGDSPTPGLASGATVGRFLVVNHRQPLFAADSQTLEFRILCPGDDHAEQLCAAVGHVVLITRGADRTVALRSAATAGWYTVDVPVEIRDDPEGFAYFLEARDPVAGTSVRFPAGGRAAPLTVVGDTPATPVSLGTHEFGSTSLGVELAAFPWGSEDGRLGTLLTSSGVEPPAAIAAAAGDVAILDQANGRAVRLGRAWDVIGSVPIPITSRWVALAPTGEVVIADEDGDDVVLTVLDGGGVAIRSARRPGGPIGGIATTSAGVWLQIHPTERWELVDPAEPTTSTPIVRTGRPSQAGGEVAVSLALDGSTLEVLQSRDDIPRSRWRIESATEMATVEVAESLADGRVVVVVALRDDRVDGSVGEFAVVVLDSDGVAQRLNIGVETIGETTPGGSFAIQGTNLLHLASSPSGATLRAYQLGERK